MRAKRSTVRLRRVNVVDGMVDFTVTEKTCHARDNMRSRMPMETTNSTRVNAGRAEPTIILKLNCFSGTITFITTSNRQEEAARADLTGPGSRIITLRRCRF